MQENQPKRTTPQRRNPHSPLKFRERFHSEGIDCDVNILFKVKKAPTEEGKSKYSNPQVNVTKWNKPSRLAEAMKICLTEVLNSFSKDELKNYTVQLLMNNCPLNDLNDPECPSAIVEVPGQTCESCRANSRPQTGNQSSPFNPRHSARTNRRRQSGNRPPHSNVTCNSNREFSNGRQKRGGKSMPGSCTENDYVCPTEDPRFLTPSDLSGKSDKEETNLNRIMSLIDALCELRPLAERPSVQKQLGECGQLCGPNTLDCEAKNGEVSGDSSLHNVRRQLFPHDQSNANDEFTPHRSIEEQHRGCGEWTEGIEPLNHTDLCLSCFPQGELCNSPPMSYTPFARSNVNTVYRRPNPNMNVTERSCDPPLPTVRPNSPTVVEPRKFLSLSAGAPPCPLVTPRMGLYDNYRRMNKTL